MLEFDVEHCPRAAGFSWPAAIWTGLVAAVAFVVYSLHQDRILSEEQCILLGSILLPVSVFLLSGAGQSRTGEAPDCDDGSS